MRKDEMKTKRHTGHKRGYKMNCFSIMKYIIVIFYFGGVDKSMKIDRNFK